jgi:3-hydroxyacyl-[acyl-carrier-protein] dehydratase
MPPKPLIDLATLDLNRIEDGPEGIRKCNPQRYEFEQLNGIIHFDAQQGIAVGFKDVKADEFWVRGHIPGRPLYPGVLMCEAAAQLCSYCYKRLSQTERFVGFGGLDAVKFRAPVVPGDRLIIVAKSTEITSRRAVFDVQAFVNGKMVYEGVVTGMPM